MLFLPVSVFAMAMFHPEMLDLFLSTLGIWLTVRLLRGRDNLWLAAAAGLALGLAQLVRAFSLWTLAAAAVGLLVARRWSALAVVLAVAVLVPTPWYVRQWIVYGTPLPFNQKAPHTAIYERRPARFYLDPGLPEVITAPYRPNFVNLAIPTTYTSLWGDYFGHWIWNGSFRRTLTHSAKRALIRQSILGLLPTLLAIVGSALLLVRSLRVPPRLVVALLAPLGLLGYLYFTVSYPTPDGAVLKATYMLTTAPGWALGFAYLLGQLPPRVRLGLGAILVLSIAAELPFLIYS